MGASKKLAIGVAVIAVIGIAVLFVNGMRGESLIQAPQNNNTNPGNPKTVSLQHLTTVDKVEGSKPEVNQVHLMNKTTYVLGGGEQKTITFSTATSQEARIVGTVTIRGDFGATLQLRDANGDCKNLMCCQTVYLNDPYRGTRGSGAQIPVNILAQAGKQQQLILSVDPRATNPQTLTLDLDVQYKDTKRQ